MMMNLPAWAAKGATRLAVPSYSRYFFASSATSSTRAKYMIETSEVADLIQKADPKLRFLNASWYLPGSEIDVHE